MPGDVRGIPVNVQDRAVGFPAFSPKEPPMQLDAVIRLEKDVFELKLMIDRRTSDALVGIIKDAIATEHGQNGSRGSYGRL